MDRRRRRILNDNPADYLIPVHADTPRFDAHIVPEHGSHLASAIKGIGMLALQAIADHLIYRTC